MTVAVAIVLLLVLTSVVALFGAMRIAVTHDRGFDICGGDGFHLRPSDDRRRLKID